MDGIDVSNYQRDIDLDSVPYAFVIAKATQGRSYVSLDCARQVEQACARGKLFSTYHYIDDSGAIGEADFFVDSVANWVGEGVLCLDWESNQNAARGNEDYLRQAAERVIGCTGVCPIIYVQQSRMAAVRPVADALDCGLWVAQYADMGQTGYQETPWNEGAYPCAIRQYSSCGRLSGYGGNLGLDKAYMDATAWKRYANPSGSASPSPAPSAPSGSTLDLAIGVMQGRCGTGDARKTVLGSRYDEVQAIVNGSAPTERTYTVKSGDTLSGISAELGVSWKDIANKNGIKSPYTIYPGQRLVI